MFISFSKTIARFGGFRIGVGMRLNKKNSWIMLFLLLFVALFKMMWYMLILSFWLMYAFCYGTYWCIKKLVQTFAKTTKKIEDAENREIEVCKSVKEIQCEEQAEINIKMTAPKKKTIIVIAVLIILFLIGFALGSNVSKEKQEENSSSIEQEESNQSNSSGVIIPDDGEDSNTVIVDDSLEDSNNKVQDDETNKPDKIQPDDDNEKEDPIDPDDTTDESEDDGLTMVWIPDTGKKYHSDEHCRWMESPTLVTLEEAKRLGYEPCKICKP
jgi:hypothetical protein